MIESLLVQRIKIEDSVAVKHISNTYKFSDLENMSNFTAQMLLKMGVTEKNRIITLIKNPLNYVLTFFGLRKIGAIMVPVNPNLGKSFLQFAINDIKPALVIDDYFSTGSKSEEIAGSEDRNFEYKTRLDLNETAMILYTGGTTGLPKGAMIQESSIISNAIITDLSWGLTKQDCTVLSLPFYHTGGWNVLFFPLMYVGGVSIIPETDKFDPAWTIKTLYEEGCTVFMGVPTMLDAISKLQMFDQLDLSKVLFINGGGPLPPTVAERFFKKGYRIFQGYGLTEAGPNNFYISPERYFLKPKSVGKPILFVQMKIAEDGELLIKGPHVFKGYWNRPEENPFTEDEYLKTGDIFTMDEEGDFYFLDRKKDMIKTGGENVYSTEVEMALKQLPYIEDAAVFGVPDEHWGERVVAVVVRKSNISEETVKNDLKKFLASYKVPKNIIFLKWIPKTQVGKVSKSELRRIHLENGFKDYKED